MSRTVGIGKQDFDTIITGNYFYVDKTYFIKEWWDNGDDVTLVTRACLINHFCNLHAPLRGIFDSDSVSVAHYACLTQTKSPTNCAALLAESIF